MNMPLKLAGAVPLTHLGLMRARGAEAAPFLHGQLTNDVVQLEPAQARLAGFCSAKGRLQASFIVWKEAPDDLLLVCSASVLPATLKRLSMFVLRARCKLGPAAPELELVGLAGTSAASRLGDASVWEKRVIAEGTLVRLPDVEGVSRALLVRPHGAAPMPDPALVLDTWRWLEVRSGVPTIEAATVDQFVPQMLNYELIGGVDFRKGCYPGQEVVARSQYRGTIKRRMFLFDGDAVAAPGQEVFVESDPAQPAGMVVNAAPHPDGAGCSALVELKLAALDAGGVFLGSLQGLALRRVDLPYAVPHEAAESTP